MLRRVRQIGDMAKVSYVRQKEQLGLGHAVLMAKELEGHEPVAVILSDDVVQSERSCIGQLIDADQHTGGSTLAVMEVPEEETSRYGIVDIDAEWKDSDVRLNRIRGMVEKPESDPPSNKAIIGRYVLTPKIFEKLEQTQAGAGGEIQLTDAIEALMEEQEVFSFAFDGVRHDAGTTMGWLKASVQLALDRDDIGGEFREYLAGIDLQ
jgi:UTP--glucose-1-phosphate uridylyltransferase